MQTIEITTDEQLEEFVSDADQSNYFAKDSTGARFVIFSTEDDGFYATRPAWEGDEREDGTHPEGVTTALDDLHQPITIYVIPEQ